MLGDKVADMDVLNNAPADYTRIGVGVRNVQTDEDSSRQPNDDEFREAFAAVIYGNTASLDPVTQVVEQVASLSRAG